MAIDWRRLGLCLSDPEMWWDTKRTAEAIHQCLVHCPVLWECRAQSLKARPYGGVMGGIAWVARGKGLTTGKPALYRVQATACTKCRVETARPCGFCGEDTGEIYGPNPRKTAHPWCKDDHRQTAREINSRIMASVRRRKKKTPQ